MEPIGWQLMSMTTPGSAMRTSTVTRLSKQRLAPAQDSSDSAANYSLYPTFPVAEGEVSRGYESLARCIATSGFVRIDGFIGVCWDVLRDCLQVALELRGLAPIWIDVADAQRPREDISDLVEPFLGGDDPLFGTRFQGTLSDFFDHSRLEAIGNGTYESLTIVYGCGAALVEGDGPIIYVDLPKNELQYRSRAAAVANLGETAPIPPKEQYKRFYFVDWPVLNQHKAALVNRVDWFVDGQRPDEPTLVAGNVMRDALDRMSRNVFRVRPWLEAGPWGGQWLKRQLEVLPQEEPNYAWSFELIVPENGIAFGDGKLQCEISFDWLMYYRQREILGDSADRFGHEFPIRFDFLDTIDGGNLSLQCHPRPEYIRAHFGESFTQDETYYILDCKDGAEVYLGFREGVDETAFREELDRSFETSTPVDVKQYVQALPAHRHDLFLIPSGTIHCSGADNMVLEISATPYIFTFKMYDWLRLGLDGMPRPLNIDRAFKNLRFDRQGDLVRRELVSEPKTIARGADWRLVHLPTHDEHFYDVHRFDFATEVIGQTNGSPHVLMLVEGASIVVETEQGMRQQFNFAETFVIPAAAGSYRLINQGPGQARVIKAFIKSATRTRS
jgi:mannose-6-phosphate isomerase class I